MVKFKRDKQSEVYYSEDNFWKISKNTDLHEWDLWELASDGRYRLRHPFGRLREAKEYVNTMQDVV